MMRLTLETERFELTHNGDISFDLIFINDLETKKQFSVRLDDAYDLADAITATKSLLTGTNNGYNAR